MRHDHVIHHPPSTIPHRTSLTNDERGITTVIALFTLLVLIMLCLLLAGLMASGSEEARSLLRAKQSFYLGDAGTFIGKQLILDNGVNWRPWNGSAYQCPSGWTGGADDSNTHYCSTTMTVGNRTGTIKVYICQLGTTTGDSANPCTDAATVEDDLEVLGFGILSGA